MKLTRSILTFSAIAMLSGCIVIAETSHANIHSQKEFTLDAHALKKLTIDAGAGSLSIRGKEGLKEIQVKADIYTHSKSADNYELTLSDSGSTAYLVAKSASQNGISWGSSSRINLEVLVPKNMMLDIDDGSGELHISHITGDVNISDGSGDIALTEVVGDLKIVDGSGSMDIAHVKGDVNIKDGSGDMQLTDISGNVDIDDGSGSIYASNVSGSAKIDDGSGDLTVREVSGLVTIDDGSGDIDVEGAGSLTIIESGSGDLRVKAISGDFEIDS